MVIEYVLDFHTNFEGRLFLSRFNLRVMGAGNTNGFRECFLCVAASLAQLDEFDSHLFFLLSGFVLGRFIRL